MDKIAGEAHSRSVDWVPRRCPRCHAEVRVPRGERAAVCGACSQPFELLVLAVDNGRAPPAMNPMDASVQPLVPFALAVIGMTVLAIFASIALIFINRADSRAAVDRFAHRSTHVPPAIPAPAFESRAMVWYEPEAPFAVRLAGGRAGIAGIFAREDGRVGRVWLGAFDAQTLAPAWSVGPLGETAEATLYLHALAVGDAVVVTDSRGLARVVDAATGKDRAAAPLRARASELCASPEGKVWVGFASAPGALLDLASARSVPATRPAWCPDASATEVPECRALAARVKLHASCGAASSAPGLYAFSPAWTLRSDELTVVIGRDAERGHRPALAAFAQGARTPLWRATLPGASEELGPRLPLLADVIGDAVYVKAEWQQPPFHPRLYALDAKTGKLRWTAELPREEHVPPPSLAVADGRVLVTTEGQLQILDAETGALQGTLGD